MFMPAEHVSDLKFEIGHVLFIDIVGYSTLLIDEQSQQLETLKKIVRGTDQFRLAEAEGKLLRLPTGDGGALVFRTTPEAPVLCALEISKALKNHPEFHVRIGIHSGPVNEIADLNEQANIAGAGINIAQRVMDCGDAGHILLSQHVADDLEQYPRWRPYLHELGECEVKHGARLGVVNLYGDEIGNPQVPRQLKVLQKHRARTRWAAIAAAFLLLIGVVAAFVVVSKKSREPISPIPKKSIAVLPFENLSGDPNNVYFTEGVQEEVLTRLAKVADLKVIARSSTQKFKSAPENLSDIPKQLGALNVLEGSVQKVNDQVRVNVQLINALTNAHLWAEIYDRKLTDIFSVESDIAKTIADTLQAKLTDAEESVIAKHPTESMEAHELYLKGRFFWNKRTPENFEKAITYFQQAIEKDTNYALAYSGIADCYALLADYSARPPNETMPKAKAAALKSLQIDPNLAEAHASLAQILRDYDWDYAGALREIDRAIQLNPNYATAHQWRAESLSPLERHEEAIAEAKRALELDPLSIIINRILGEMYFHARRYDEAIAQFRKTIEIEPNFPSAHWMLGRAYEAKRQYSEAVEEFLKMIEVSGPGARSLGNPNEMHDAYANGGWNGYLRYFIAECRKPETTGGYKPAYPVAASFAELGEKDEAFAWLAKAYDERDYQLTLLKVAPEMDNLRSDPRFTDLLRRVGLAQ
jgi:TolB-like protein/cytochrome c-type biogenesis protein CcmH/NrfG